MSVLFLNSWRVSSHIVRYRYDTLQLFKNSIDTQGKLRLNFHSLSVSELLEYRRNPPAIQKQHLHSREAQIEPPLFECE